MCFGNNPALPMFPNTESGPVNYVDNQDGVTREGYVREFEYYATVTGVPVRFMFLQVAEASIYQFRIYHEFTHTAEQTGLIKVTYINNFNVTNVC